MNAKFNENKGKKQTEASFALKWNAYSDSFLQTTADPNSEIFNWILTRNGFSDLSGFKNWLKNRKRILDAGCGNGRVTALLAQHADQESEILGVDLVGAEIAAKNLSDFQNVSTYYADLMENLENFGQFDLIYCQEVLHHTANPQVSFKNLVNLLNQNGEIAIYVYKQKAPLREFADDHVRGIIENFNLDESSHVISQITDFARALSSINLKIYSPAVDALGIEAGEYDLQRFIYHHFFKNFWNEELSYEENFAINFDWYHPSLCSRHTMEEVLDWFHESNLRIEHKYEDPYGITVRGTKLSK